MTSILSRYVIRSVLGTTLLVMLVLLVLSGLYLFITQQDEIGIGTYTLTDALLFVGLNLLTYAFIRAKRGHFSAAHHHGVEVPGIYWHFVDVMWIIVYVTVYVI